MRVAPTLFLWLAAVPTVALAQTQPPRKSDPDRLGMTCAQILQMTSTEWIAKIAAVDASRADSQLRGIRVYGNCYDARTNSLATALAKTAKGPSANARSDFQDFQRSIEDFTAKALASANAPADSLKAAYATLYEKQFRYAFYQRHQVKSTAAVDAVTARLAPESAPSDADELTKAKNRFGELLGALPEDKLHELHAAFGRILGLHPTDSTTQLAVYRYAIFLLESVPAGLSASSSQHGAKPFSPPPF